MKVDGQTGHSKEGNVKKAILAALAGCVLISLIGCHHRDFDTAQPTQIEEFKSMQQSWRGVLPCADCEGIETSLFLEKDGSWVMNQRYLGAKEPSTFASYGRWARTADKLTLTDSDGEKIYFRAKGDALEMLDTEGNPIESTLNYTLQPVQAALPATPMIMRGMYIYRADTAVFTDCATGNEIRVASNARLERDYAAARGTQTRPILLVVKGHFAIQPNPETGAAQKVLVTTTQGTFTQDKECDD